MESKLRTSLYRAFCPDSTELGEYHLEMLPAKRRLVIHAHLRECPHCRHELEQLGAFLETVSGDLEAGPGEQLRRLVARLVGPRQAWSPALSGLRGEAGETLNFTAEGYQVVLDVESDAARPDRKAVLGLLIGEQPEIFEALLFEASSLAARAAVDDFGNFTLGPVPPGAYSLTLRGEQVEIHVEQITIA